MPPVDYLMDVSRYSSEGNWAFCRFDSDEIPALRLGFQRGGFNAGKHPRHPSPAYLQLHFEILTREGALLWLPSGRYSAQSVLSDMDSMNISLNHAGTRIFALRNWPALECHFRSDDGELEADLRFVLDAVTVLPDCVLPHCLFGMWESMGAAHGIVKYGCRSIPVCGKVFFDHTRVLPRRHAVTPRIMYVYSTLYFDDGSGLFGYHSIDADGCPTAGYCFHVYLDAKGVGTYLQGPALERLVLDGDGIAKSWEIHCETLDFSLAVSIAVRDTVILKSWGSPSAPQTRREFSILPLVLDGHAVIKRMNHTPRTLKAYGLAEYFNANLWAADKAAEPVEAEQSSHPPLP
jgi:hypothetical protein